MDPNLNNLVNKRKRTPPSPEAKARAKERWTTWKVNNAERHRANARAWAKANPTRVWLHGVKRKFGVSAEQVEQLRNQQGEKCAICRAPLADRPNVDHCHSTGKVRGLLCRPCNLSLGGFKDSLEILLNAALYLEQHK